jgi:predicted nucleic acid-binding protein
VTSPAASLAQRSQTLELLAHLPAASVAENAEVLGLIEHFALHGKGLGYVDIHLLASVALSPGTTLWTRDKRLMAAAEEPGWSAAESGAR